jgi:hypothetical protein
MDSKEHSANCNTYIHCEACGTLREAQTDEDQKIGAEDQLSKWG